MNKQEWYEETGRWERFAALVNDPLFQMALSVVAEESEPAATDQTRMYPTVGCAKFHEQAGWTARMKALLALAKPPVKHVRVRDDGLRPTPEDLVEERPNT